MAKKHHWYVWIFLIFILITCLIYSMHYLIFRDPEHLIDYFMIHLGFLPIHVLFIGLFLEKLIAYREEKLQKKKEHMLISAFYSEAGNQLIRLFSGYVHDIDPIREKLKVTDHWTKQDFSMSKKLIGDHELIFHLDPGEKLEELRAFLLSKKSFLFNLLQNPAMGYEYFSHLLLAVYHLTEEFSYRDDLSSSGQPDLNHLAVDMRRAYVYLAHQWFEQMEYLQNDYPYLFSLALRINPFDPEASVYIQK
ncbi:hypothetical protein Sgly_3026 [Syntrophobotulus glycolicus DSM 8271]|uniref:Uncharacterized protein n=1 Tax=Syntrophobotulus glycolicus (strain DSM 8271 / FlGlyR) TaxID=645991 RepID=F0T0C3_SYNGF|nr:hypothetical protein [Syntrophobotulus glycolicus]ADY57295.1 hypothetical protein Sgly_3026 [Syntrophobotulus glycolicus DSM 8271]